MLTVISPGLFQDRPEARVRERVAGLLTGFSGPVREACGVLTQAPTDPGLSLRGRCRSGRPCARIESGTGRGLGSALRGLHGPVTGHVAAHEHGT